MANEMKRLTPEAEREIAGRVNPQYSDTPGTESNERALLLSEIQYLRQERDELRTRLAELEQQEPVAWAPSCANAEFAASVRGYGQQLTVWFDRHALERPGRGHCQTPLYARPVPAQAVPEGWRLVKVKSAEFESLMYWLDLCESKGHLDRCADLIQPWAEFAYEDIAAPEAAR